MIKHLLLVFLIFLVKLNGSTVSLIISEDLINNYLDTVGEYKYYSKRDKSEWIVQNPHVKIQNDEIIFFSKVIYRKDLVNIKKDVKRNLKVKYDLDKNNVKLVFQNSIIYMERRGKRLGTLNLKDLYEPKLIFNGPNLKTKSFKINLIKKRKVFINPNFAEIILKEKSIELVLNISFQDKR